MADKIQSIQAVGYDASRVSAVRGYTKGERKAKLEKMEKSIADHKELLDLHKEIETLYPNPEHLSFKECLEEEMNPSAKSEENDDEGFVLDIKH